VISPGTAGPRFCGASQPASSTAGRRRLHRGVEIICCDCGDDPGLDYRDVPPRLQLIRGPYPIKDGVALGYDIAAALEEEDDGTELEVELTW
jgi:hypothetical protein